MTTSISAEPMAPLDQITGPMQVALAALLQRPLFFSARDNSYVPAGGGPFPLQIRERTIDALVLRKFAFIDFVPRGHGGGKVRRVRLTPHGGWYARTVERQHKLRVERAQQIGKKTGLHPAHFMALVPQPGANDA